MVMAVVLNRVADERFPDNVHDVIFAKGQFSPISDGRYYQVTPDVECHLALAEIECGKYDNIDALYFENATGSWQSEKCEYLYTVGHHRFYRD
jgi:N-acetylmuramoyl-L-alanine amidase